ncbi:DUF1269 domain-containing protein [Thermobifida halotolerans]|uniref:DUF1269 domain-containing protein n=1 Tax=Thermobifida halotolerans TaxID=483545 RepID=A0AA97LTB2_9ACTN|nr:DUF1269 domain-containing protein [Thermobifida halotolerans]UOE17670.1 DUF1269 domain-containing protein [Thermobifida halotolerans]
MTHLVVFGVADRDRAEQALEIADDLARRELLQLRDAAYVYRDARGRPRIQQTLSTTGVGAAGGALWGTLIGTLFLSPVLGLAVGAAAGAVAGRLTDIGIDDGMIRDIGRQLQEGRAAVFLLARSATRDRVVEAFRPLEPVVLETSLTRKDEEELVRALQDEETAPSARRRSVREGS